MQDTDDDMKKS